MKLIEEIHKQSPTVRFVLWSLSVFIVISVIGFFWFTSTERRMFMAIHSDPQERANFLASRNDRAPNPLVFVGRSFGSLGAAIGGLLGFDKETGFDRPPQRDKVYLLPLSR